MPIPEGLGMAPWATILPSVFGEAAGPVHRVPAQARPHGGMRYRCPVNGSFVLVTEEVALARLDASPLRLRCTDCGELHLVAVETGFAAEPARL